MNDPAVQSLPQSDREAFEAFCREKWGDDLNHALVERCQAAAAWLAARDFYAAHPSLGRPDDREAMEAWAATYWHDRTITGRDAGPGDGFVPLPFEACWNAALAHARSRPSLDRDYGVVEAAVFGVLISKLRPFSLRDDETARLIASDTAGEIANAVVALGGPSLDREAAIDRVAAALWTKAVEQQIERTGTDFNVAHIDYEDAEDWRKVWVRGQAEAALDALATALDRGEPTDEQVERAAKALYSFGMTSGMQWAAFENAHWTTQKEHRDKARTCLTAANTPKGG